MYIDPFLAGVIVTVGFEMLALIVFALIKSFNNRR